MHLRATSLREFLFPIRMLRSSLPLSKGKQLISLPALFAILGRISAKKIRGIRVLSPGDYLKKLSA
jgi:hypothetical protein